MKPGLLLRLEAGFAYKAGARVGAPVYNAVHTYVGPCVLAIFPVTRPYALIWGAHIAIDRLLGFGLKYPTNFKDTHLQRLAVLLCLIMPVRGEAQGWPIKTREHVDLWLTAFAELSEDTAAKVPVYRRSYLDQLALAQNQQSVLTALDSVHDGLQSRWDATPKLADARGLALDAGTWDEMHSAIDLYLHPPADKRKKSKTPPPDVESRLPDYFSSPEDREWLLNLDHGIDGARKQFYHQWWVAEELKRRPILVSTDSLWRLTEPKLDRFLAATNQSAGEIILTLPVDGAGITLKGPEGRTSLAAPFPDSSAEAAQVIYVFAQVAARALAGRNDQPYMEAVGVRGGYMLLSKTAPELAEGYSRYYLRTFPAGKDLAAAFPLPDATRSALEQKIDLDLK